MTDLASAIDSFVETTIGKKQTEKTKDSSLKGESSARLAKMMEALIGMGLPPESIQVTSLPDYSTKLVFGHYKSNENAKVELTIQPVSPFLVFVKTLHPIVVEQRPVALLNPRLKDDLLGILVPYFGSYALPPTPPPIVEIVEPVEDAPPQPIVEPVPPPTEPVAVDSTDEVAVEASVEAVEPPVEEVNLPAEEVNPPVEEVNPPAEEVNLSDLAIEPPVEEVNSPIEDGKPSAEPTKATATKSRRKS